MEQNDHNPRQIYARITEQIAAAIAAGAPRYEMPWHRSGPALSRPLNAVSGNPYHGINVLALWVAAQTQGFGSGIWATYRQWNTLYAQVRKGEKGSAIVFYKQVEQTPSEANPEQEEPETRLVARASWVFNAAQVEGWEMPEIRRPNIVEVIGGAELFIGATGAEIREGGNVARYLPHADRIEMPPREAFVATSTSSATHGYYATLLHELTHWSGHERRLARDFAKRFGDEAYAMEELVAELGAAFLCADLAIANSPRLDHATYVGSWLRVLGNDPRAIFTAAGKASTAAEYLTALQEQTVSA